ncbi:MAG TPA: hypothetical protein VGU23_08935 [Acidobacteriaceae bacterium]|nr:hypothetical protein [Acidobacteriaceae bacterium]
MKRNAAAAVIAAAFTLIAFAAPATAQRLALGIAPAFDAGGDDFGPAVVEHLTLFIYQDLLANKQFAPVLLNPGGVYTPLDTSWLADYVQDRPDLDLLLISTLKPIDTAKTGSTITIELSLLDAHSGDTKSTWTVSETMKSANAWLEKGQAMITSAVTDRAGQYGIEMMSSSDFQKQPIGKTTAHLAESIRDTLPAHLAGFVRTTAAQPSNAPAVPSATPCPMHTRITYKYKHSVSHSYTLLANGLDQTTTIQDGVSTFNAPEGPLLLQFTIQDSPYKLARQPIYQLSTTHSCKTSTLVMDVGQGGDVHDHWE